MYDNVEKELFKTLSKNVQKQIREIQKVHSSSWMTVA